MAINLRCQISAGRSFTLIRNLCTAAAAAACTEKARVVSAAGAGRERRLYRRLSSVAVTGKTVSQTLNECIRAGKVPPKYELERCIRELRRYRKFHDALEIMEWMEFRHVNFSHKDLGIRLDLISKARGVAAAETYFSGLSPPEKNYFTYGALLNCYCKETLTDKALALFEKMDKLHFVSSLAINNLMTLYMRLGQPEKVPPLVQDMKSRNIPLSTYTFNIWMQSLSHLNDIDGVERVCEEMARDLIEERDWTTYSNLAAVYVKAELHEKAEYVLKKLEKEIRPLKHDAFHFMISLYAGISNLDEVHRIWKVLKSSFETTTNRSYLIMLQALAKLNDIDGLKKCYEEWESSCSCYDLRIANTTIGAYLRFDKIEEAESVFHKAVKRSSGLFYNIWYNFVAFFLKKRQMDLAMRCMEAAISEVEKEKNRVHPVPVSVENFMRYFEEERDVDGAEKLCKLLKKINCLDSGMYGLLLQTYIAANKTEPGMRKRMEEDSIELNSKLDDLLKKVCPE